MNRRKWTDLEFIDHVASSLSYAEVLRKLNLKAAGSNYNTVRRKISELGLDISHMTGQGWNTGTRYMPLKIPQPIEEILVNNSNYTNTSKLRKRLLKEGLKEHKCENCNKKEWLSNPIPLELHHINGIKSDLRITNLQILCPNCHALTDNYRGKNIGLSDGIGQTCQT